MPKSKSIKVQGITVTGEKGIDLKVASESKTFTDWLNGVDKDRFTINGIHFQSVDMFGPKVGFIKFVCDVTDSDGKFIPGIIFARGGSVAVVVLVECEGEEYAVVTVQPRIATGSFEFQEVCAGMLDGAGSFAGAAAKELEEELAITIDGEDLVDLTALAGFDSGIYLSPGGSEEAMKFFGYSTSMTRSEFDSLNGRLTGVLEEGEQITVKLIPVDGLLEIPDAKTLVAHSFVTRFRDSL